MNRELRKNGLKTRVIIVLLLVAFILLGFRMASNASPNEYGETDTVPEARVTYANASSDAASQLYKALLNRETNFSITCGNSSDVYTRLENEELFKEVASKDDPNTSDDFDYLFNNLNLIPAEFLKQTNLPKSTVYTTLRQLETAGYIVRTGSERKSRFVFQKLLDVI